MNEALREVLSRLRSGLTELYGERLAGMHLFGSHARGDSEPGSDIDVLVVLKGEVDPGLEIARSGPLVAPLCLATDQVISCLFLSERRFLTEQSPLVLNVRRESVPL
jgi:predicted nucleotidyltransferase